MKNLSVFILAIVVAFSGVACQSLNSSDPLVRIQASLPYLRTSSMLIATSVFGYAVSEEDRAAKAQVVYDIAEVIEGLTAEGDISVESIALVVSNYLPERSHWDEFATNLILLYADVYGSTDIFTDTDRKKVLIKALNYIAAGCKAAARVYL